LRRNTELNINDASFNNYTLPPDVLSLGAGRRNDSLAYYVALKKAGVLVEVHLYTRQIVWACGVDWARGLRSRVAAERSMRPRSMLV